jgi:Undecaprenyl-phosphate galactose phosphotransferase WbaP
MSNDAQDARIELVGTRPIRPQNAEAQASPRELDVSRCRHLALYLVQHLRDIVPIALVALGDFCGLLIGGYLAILMRHTVAPARLELRFYPILAAYSGLMVFSYFAVGLYSGITRSGPDELRRLTLATTAMTLIIAAVTYVSRDHLKVDVSIYVMAWTSMLFAIPLGRAAVRGMFGRYAWWGRKAVIFAHDGRTARRVVKSLHNHPRLALKPVAVLTGEADLNDEWNLGLPVLHDASAAPTKAKLRSVDHAIIAMPDLNSVEGLNLIRRHEFMFKHWTIVPYFAQSYSLWVRPHELDGLLGLELTHHLLVPSHQVLKRALDLTLTFIGSIVALPLCLLIALAIKIDSRGAVLYSQRRLGKGGKAFPAFKFRSMASNAEETLQEHLAQHPELREEWNATQKLKHDPRITRLGRFLRRTSLDELPQLLNVLRGEMSLVGPRPCMPEQACLYDWVWEFYKRVRPGITGQWQISGRNRLSFRERTMMNAYYIRNWSVWLDLYILVKTIPIVVRGDGAY